MNKIQINRKNYSIMQGLKKLFFLILCSLLSIFLFSQNYSIDPSRSKLKEIFKQNFEGRTHMPKIKPNSNSYFKDRYKYWKFCNEEYLAADTITLVNLAGNVTDSCLLGFWWVVGKDKIFFRTEVQVPGDYMLRVGNSKQSYKIKVKKRKKNVLIEIWDVNKKIVLEGFKVLSLIKKNQTKKESLPVYYLELRRVIKPAEHPLF